MVNRVTATEVSRTTVQNGTYQMVAEIEDGANNTIEAYVTLDESQGHAYLCIKEHDTGVLLDEIEVAPDQGAKVDTASIWLRGGKVRLRLGCHLPGPAQPRTLPLDLYDWASPFIVPIPVGGQPMGRPGAYPITPETGGGGVTLDELTTALSDGHSPISRAMATIVKNNARIAIGAEGIPHEVQQALMDLWRKDSPDPLAQQFQQRFDQDVRDRAYEADTSVEAGEPPPKP